MLPTIFWKHTPTLERDRYNEANVAISKMLRKVITDYEQNPPSSDSHDLLTLMYTKTNFSRAELLAEARSFFIAGFETTAKTLAWVVYLLAAHPEIQDKLSAKIQKVTDGKPDPSYEEIQEIEYLKYFIEESMRLYPISPYLIREAENNAIINGVQLPQGTEIFVSSWTMQRDPKYWKEPDTFLPERWKPSHPFYNKDQFAQMPFGGGQRVCIGKRFAITNMKTILVHILPKFKISLAEDFVVKEKTELTMGPEKVLVTVTKR